MSDDERQAMLDHEHLRLLRLGYLISGGANAVMALFPLIHVTVGLTILLGGFPGAMGTNGPPDARFMGLMFVVIGAMLSSMFAVYGALKLMAARRLRERRSKTFCLIVAGISCFGIPYGTALGALTMIVLARPSVAALFEGSGSEPAPPS